MQETARSEFKHMSTGKERLEMYGSHINPIQSTRDSLLEKEIGNLEHDRGAMNELVQFTSQLYTQVIVRMLELC